MSSKNLYEIRCFYFTNQLSQPVNLQGSYDFYVFKAQSNFLNLQSVKQLNIYSVLYIYFTSLFCKFMISNVRKPIFFWNPIHFHRKFCWITSYFAVISCLSVLIREFFPIFITFMIIPIYIFQICNEYEMIFSPETEFFLENLIFFHRQTCFIANIFVKSTAVKPLPWFYCYTVL